MWFRSAPDDETDEAPAGAFDPFDGLAVAVGAAGFWRPCRLSVEENVSVVTDEAPPPPQAGSKLTNKTAQRSLSLLIKIGNLQNVSHVWKNGTQPSPLLYSFTVNLLTN